MTQPAKAQEPSMEEILASIRRIISDDEAKPAAAAKPEPTPVPKNEPPRAAAPAAKPAVASVPPPKAAPSKPTPLPAAPTPAPPPAAKNSQDDIDAMLASFDNPAPAAPLPAPAPEPVDSVDDDVFELTEQMAIPAAAVAADDAGDDDLEFAESAAQPQPRIEPAPIERIAPIQSSATPSPVTPSMLSSTTTAAVELAFNTLASTVLSHNARTLEDLVKEMLRPMLKSWLDDNLPSLVERIVKAEIERVARGR